MLSYIAIFLSTISTILMIVILIKFKKLFSTESIIEKTKAQINRVIIDVNNNANRDIELINEATKRTRALLNDADKKMDSFKEASERLKNIIAETEKVKSNNKSSIYINPEDSYEITKKEVKQGSLFDEEISVNNEKSILKDETKVRPDGVAYKEVPLIVTKIFNDKTANKPVNDKSNKSIKEKVEKMFYQGMQVDDIAAELSCSISEIQFIIDML